MKNFDTIQEFNDMLGVVTQHPLVSVVDMNQAGEMYHMRHTNSFYSVFLKDEENCELIYGRKRYDFTKGSVVCLAPGQVIGSENVNNQTFQPLGWGLFFDPELVRGTQLGKRMKEYTFFSYNVDEALHLSEKERKIFVLCLQQIQAELDNNIDRLSRRLICSNIEILLDHCLRFYERQFNTREVMNHDLLERFETLLNEYFTGSNAEEKGLPTVKYFASELCLSPNYFGDLVKKEIGQSAQDYIKHKVLSVVKDRLADPVLSISDVSYSTGFQYPQHLSRFFKKEVGISPADYRRRLIAG